MGKAKITSGGTGGLYNIELVRNTSKITAAIDTITARLALLAPAIASALIAKNSAEAVLSAKRAALDEAIGKFILSQITSADVSSVQKEYLAALTSYRDKSVAYSLLLQEQESKSKSKTLLQAALSPEYRNNIWCADLTENLPSGEEVGTIEVNGEKTQIIIYPGGDWDSLPESVLQPVLASSSAGAFYNQAILPGWQKWKPTYRIGTITAISGDLCTVSLVATFSSQQGLNINMMPGTISLSNVPIEYMDGINGSIFVVGDRVIVEFTGQSWASPKVIGFESNPRAAANLLNNNYYIFYQTDGILKIANCSFASGITVTDTKNYDKVFTSNTAIPIIFHAKRFTNNISEGSSIVTRDLYFIATSLWINPNPFPGWVNFATANPASPMITNNSNTQITMTAQVMADLNSVNAGVNNTHAYVSDPAGNDNWHILGTGESGDCEDFALTKAKLLLDLGYPASAIHIECGLVDGTTTGHAWLVVQTTSGDYALDRVSNSAILNSVLKTGSGIDYICRRRQIGSNWAFISAYAWLLGSSNTENYVFYYILDPLLNIFYMLPSYYPNFYTWSGLPFVGRDQFLNPGRVITGNSINFSADKIFIAEGYEYLSSPVVTIKTYELRENQLVFISQTTQSGFGYVNREGNFVAHPGYDYNCDIAAKNGYYDFAFIPYDAGVNPLYQHQILSKNFGIPFSFNRTDAATPYYTMPNGEVISAHAGLYFYCYAWLQIDTDNLLIHAVRGDTGNKMYKDGISCLDAVTAAVGTTEENLLGLVYIPCTDRLNR